MKDTIIIKRQQIDGALAFLRVAAHRNFRAAAADLGVSPSALSQTIKALEVNMGVPLLSRTTRSVGLTEAGALFLEQLSPSVKGLQTAFETVQTFAGRPSGLLRINASRGVIPFLLGQILDDFAKSYPQVDIELYADDGLADIVEGGFDAGIRLGELLQSDMVAIRLTPPFSFCVVASPEYLEAHGAPAQPEDLRQHQCVRFRHSTSGGIYRWQFAHGQREFEIAVNGQLIVNDTDVMVAAALRGAGFIYVAEPIVEEHITEGRLVTALEDFCPTSPGLFLYYPNRMQALPKLKAFVDFMRRMANGRPEQRPPNR
ncbi:MAG: LysR family transcriptional regulator [Mesorhizobium sp.]|uniref:LysR family transcriptional regulator n=1 Tax=Mesorhizobium sp. TaxID=1871066 RepID=UPI000FE7E0E0|nr:LysR family transcriptional regulator [Mesorhizobium sp.]RWI54742.1 MAG: LysR family transcriptional regulator [Mesorhizobium sp.]